jgi:hypothetical protein
MAVTLTIPGGLQAIAKYRRYLQHFVSKQLQLLAVGEGYGVIMLILAGDP